MAIKGVAFDLEDTVIHVGNVHFEAFARAAEEIGVIFDRNNLAADIARQIENAIGGGDALIAEGISQLSGRSAAGAEIRRRKVRFYDEIIEGFVSIEPRPGFLDVLEQIRTRGFPIAIASMTPRRQAEILLERSGIAKIFPGNLILLEDSVKHLKPAPDVYLEAARRMGIPPSKQLVFEDSATGIKAARAAGSPVIAMPGYTFSENLTKLREAGATKIFYGWEEVDIAALLQEFD
ncbi:MAG: HAD family phosphatase [Candidatus Wildermuthbacteria bacterium]|nr:HAD family phosphatase [Candidatus Wildermuthbacteria bacterium]